MLLGNGALTLPITQRAAKPEQPPAFRPAPGNADAYRDPPAQQGDWVSSLLQCNLTPFLLKHAVGSNPSASSNVALLGRAAVEWITDILAADVWEVLPLSRDRNRRIPSSVWPLSSRHHLEVWIRSVMSAGFCRRVSKNCIISKYTADGSS